MFPVLPQWHWLPRSIYFTSGMYFFTNRVGHPGARVCPPRKAQAPDAGDSKGGDAVRAGRDRGLPRRVDEPGLAQHGRHDDYAAQAGLAMGENE